jgi:hypothetical protein
LRQDWRSFLPSLWSSGGRAATHRYEQLKHAARARSEPAADIARLIYMEFYSDG